MKSELLRTTQELAGANAKASEANARLAEEQGKVIKMLKELRKASEARMEAEQASLERLRELGMVNARGIIEWAETRSKKIKSQRRNMNKFKLWSDIFESNPKLADCLEEAGWPRGSLPSNMLGLYANLSSDIHKDATPIVSDAIGGIIISVNDVGSGVNATAAKVLLCLAKFNYIRARLEGADGTPIGESMGLSKKENREKYLREEKTFAQAPSEGADDIMQ